MEPFQFSIYVIPILVSVIASICLSVIAWRHREYEYARSLMVLMCGVTWWSVTNVIGLSTSVPALKRVAYSLTYPAVGLVSIAWFVFAIQYSGRLRVPTKREFAALGVIPGLTTVAALTNQYHGLVWASADIVARGQLELLNPTHGVLFWVHALQSYALIGLGTTLILLMALLSDRAYRSELVTLSLTVTFPLVVNLLYLTGVTPVVDLTPAAFALSGTLLIAAAFRDQFLQSMPLAREIARDELIRQMASPVIVVDNRAHVVDLNPAAESLTDPAADSIGSHVGTAFPDISDPDKLRPETIEETTTVTVDGETERHYDVQKIPLHRGGGAIRGHLLRMHDTTEQRNRQEALVEERQFIDQALDALDDLFYVVDVDGTLRRWNNQFIKVTGYSESELDGMNVIELFPEADREVVTEGIEKTLEDGEITIEQDLLTDDGKRIPHEFTGARLKDEDGNLSGLVGVGRDISARKERERRLRTFQEAVENAGRMIYWMDSDGTIEYVNPALETQTKCDASELVGEQMLPLADRAQSETLADDVLDTLSRGEMWKGESTIRRNDGEHRTIDQTIKPVYADGELERFVAVAGDITEKTRQKQQLSVLQRILRHDLRNNLNVILLSVQLARREATNEDVRQSLDGATQTIDETLSLSRDVRQFEEAFQAGEIDNTVVDIGETTREQLATLRGERPDVDFSVDLSGTTRVLTNNLIERAIRNVLRNAVDHNDSNTPRVSVALNHRPETDNVELRIADNGPGIPDETIDVLNSKREEQLDHLNGFGLWLVHWVLTLSGGRLEFAENKPRGTVVKLVLPAAQATQPGRAIH